MSAARIDSSGAVAILDGMADPDEIITEDDVQDAKKLARYLARCLKQTAELQRRANPRRIDFEDVTVSTAGAVVSLEHGFGGRVRWWVVGWQSAAVTAPYLVESTTATTDRTLVLRSYVAGAATIRVEAA